MYQEIQPSKGLANLIDSFWTFSKNKADESFKVLPDNCADLIFDCKLNQGFLSGVMTKYQLRKLDTESDLIGIRFKTENFGWLSKIPLDETKNLRIELAHILPETNHNISSKLNDLENLKAKIDFLENFIETSFRQNHTTQDKLILSVSQEIRLLGGTAKIDDLARSHCISLRQLERRFKNYIGLSLKEFSRIVRFNNAKKSIATLKNNSLLEIASDMDFFDHAHMTYEFKRISGENPSFYR